VTVPGVARHVPRAQPHTSGDLGGMCVDKVFSSTSRTSTAQSPALSAVQGDYGMTPALPVHSNGKLGFAQVEGLSTERM